MSNHVITADSLTGLLPKPPHAVHTLHLPAKHDAERNIDRPDMVCFVQFREGEIPTIIGYHSSNGAIWCGAWTPDTIEAAIAEWKRYRANGWMEKP